MNKNFVILTSVTIGITVLLLMGMVFAYRAIDSHTQDLNSQIITLDRRLQSNQLRITELAAQRQIVLNTLEKNAATAAYAAQFNAAIAQTPVVNVPAMTSLAATSAPTTTTTSTVAKSKSTTTVSKPATTTTTTTTTPKTTTVKPAPVVRRTRAS